MRSFILTIALVTMVAACITDVREKLIGNWKFVSGTEPAKPIFPAVEFMKFQTEKGFYMFFGSRHTGFITASGDTFSSDRYDILGDSLIIHKDDQDLVWHFGFLDDTLWLGAEGTRLKFKRMK